MSRKSTTVNTVLPKSPTGIQGLDEITGGGLPKGRPTLIVGSAGAGKTLMAMEFLVNGAVEFNEPGVFMAFEETSDDLAQNVASLGFDLPALIDKKELRIDHVRVERSEIEETGEYDLEGLFIRLGHAIDTIGAKRVVLDTIESLFSGLNNTAILRAELRRLFHWLKEKGVTAVITAERGDATLSKQGLEEYVSDCVILLDHRVHDQISTRRLRVVKYRGSTHGTNEYPYLIDEEGILVLPITSMKLDHDVSTERISTGIASLDALFGGKGLYRGSTVLISGTAGTGKSSLGIHMAEASCRRNERCLYLAFEESPQQITRNMRSIGIDVDPYITKSLLQIHSSRPSLSGLEAHLLTIHKLIRAFKPRMVIIDPITNLIGVGNSDEVRAMLTRLIDFLKTAQTTAVMTSLTRGDFLEQTDVGVSSLVDTWLMVRDLENNGERNRGMYILKSRGMHHSNQIREFILTDKGADLVDVYIGSKGVLTGSARLAQEKQDKLEAARRESDGRRRKQALTSRGRALDEQIKGLRADFAAQEEEMKYAAEQEQLEDTMLVQYRAEQGRTRQNKTTRPSGAKPSKGDKK